MAASEPTALLSENLHILLRLASIQGPYPKSGLFPSRVSSLPQHTHSSLLRQQEIRSLTGWLGLSTLDYPIGNSTLRLPQTRLHLDAFREEPAIAGFDRLFTTNPRSPEGFVTHHRYRASILLSEDFTLPWVSSPSFGSYPSNFRRFHTLSLSA